LPKKLIQRYCKELEVELEDSERVRGQMVAHYTGDSKEMQRQPSIIFSRKRRREVSEEEGYRRKSIRDRNDKYNDDDDDDDDDSKDIDDNNDDEDTDEKPRVSKETANLDTLPSAEKVNSNRPPRRSFSRR